MSVAPPKPPALAPGYRLDRYELLCPIAEGGMAGVWVARQRGKHGFERLVAIKTILPKYASDERFQQMFLDEARIAAGIVHANVAQILDLGDEHDVVYLVMEWVDGDSLSKLMRVTEKRRVAIPQGVMCRIVADVAGGLHAAHELVDTMGRRLGVVHRDVSPQNILISTKGVAKLIDFGIAKARDRLAGDTSVGQLKGKVQYMAPEQALGQAIDRRADVFAIGAILYHMMAGRCAYEGKNQLATLHELTSGKPPPPLSPSVPAPIAEVIKRALRFKPEGRYETAAEMQQALEKAMVAANLATSTVEVGTFTQTHMSDRAVARRKAVDLALRAAADRAHMNELLRPATSGFAESLETPSGRSRSGRSGSVRPPALRESGPAPPEIPSPQSSLGASALMPLPPRIPAQEASALGVSAVMPPKVPSQAPSALGVSAVTPPPPKVPSQAPSAPGVSPVMMPAPEVPSQESSTLGVFGVLTPALDHLPFAINRRKTVITVVVGSVIGLAAMIVLVAAISRAKTPREERAKAASGRSPAALVQHEDELTRPGMDLSPPPPPTVTIATVAPPAIAPPLMHAPAPKANGKPAKSGPDDGF